MRPHWARGLGDRKAWRSFDTMTSKPDAIVTKHLIRNILVTLILTAAAVFGVLWWRNLSERKPAINTVTEEQETEPEEVQEAESPYILSVEDAKGAITDYYTLLAQNDFAGLRSRGFAEVSGAVEMGWTRQIQLEIHPEYIVPDVTNMPEPVDVYAGNDLYEISSFFATVPPAQCVKSVVTGETGPIGWIYHDALDGQWHIIDPTIPLGTQAPIASNQSRQSSDKLVLVEMSSPGVFRNQWWAITMFTVSITSASKVSNVGVARKAFDAGVTVEIPDTLAVGISAADVPVVPTTNADGTTNPMVAKINGICTVWRGERTQFNRERIGQGLQQLDGANLAPVSITVGNEDITPDFPVDNRSAETTAALLNEEQIKRYGVDGVIVTMPVADQVLYEQEVMGSTTPVSVPDGTDGTGVYPEAGYDGTTTDTAIPTDVTTTQ